MAFGRYRGTSSFDGNPADAGSTILKLTNKILADLQVDNSQQAKEAGVVRNVRSYSDPSGGVDARESLPAYYDTSTILQPARNPNMPNLAPVSTSNELEDFDPLISHSQPAIVAPEDPYLNSQQVEQELPATQVTSELSKYLHSEMGKSDNDDDFWAFFDGERQSTHIPTDTRNDISATSDKQESLPQESVTLLNGSETSLPQSNDTKLDDHETQITHDECIESREDTSVKLTLSTNTGDISDDDDDDDDDEQTTGSRLMATHPHSKPFVARFIKLSPFGSISPELPKVKIIIVGDANTGKSCFLHKYIHGCFDYQSQPTVGVDICSLPLEDKKSGKQLVTQLWDTQGQERFNSLTTTYFRGSHGAIIVYDITNYKSLNNAYNWKSEVEKATSINPFTHIPTVLVGNKLDLAKDQETSGANDIADKLDIDRCFETSSKDGRGIDEVVDYLLEQILKKKLLSELTSEQETITLDKTDKLLDKKKCCSKSS